MNFFKILLTFIYLLFSSVAYADSHDAQQNIVEKAKEINQKIKKDQALKAANNQNAAGKEEPLPLNDPFVGDSSFSGGVKVITEDGNSLAEKKRIDLYTYKLVGIIKSDSDSFISLINQDGEVITVGMFEELNDGVKLVDLTTKEAIFQTDEKYLIMNFKNQIKETSEY